MTDEDGNRRALRVLVCWALLCVMGRTIATPRAADTSQCDDLLQEEDAESRQSGGLDPRPSVLLVSLYFNQDPELLTAQQRDNLLKTISVMMSVRVDSLEMTAVRPTSSHQTSVHLLSSTYEGPGASCDTAHSAHTTVTWKSTSECDGDEYDLSCEAGHASLLRLLIGHVAVSVSSPPFCGWRLTNCLARASMARRAARHARELMVAGEEGSGDEVQDELLYDEDDELLVTQPVTTATATESLHRSTQAVMSDLVSEDRENTDNTPSSPIPITTPYDTDPQSTPSPSSSVDQVSDDMDEILVSGDEAGTAAVNQPPRLNHRLPKLILTAGRPFKRLVPQDMFIDEETGGTRRLLLSMTSPDNGQPLAHDSWLQFDPANQTIYALPTDVDIGDYKYLLSASDETGAAAADTVHVTVRQFQQWRLINHLVHVHLRLTDIKAFSVTIDWRLLIMRRIAGLFGESQFGSVMIYKISSDQSGSLTRFSWFNSSLDTHICHKQEIDRMSQILLDSEEESGASQQLLTALSPQFSVKHTALELRHGCEAVSRAVNVSSTGLAPRLSSNTAPVRRRSLDLLQAHVGRLLRVQVGEDAFYDLEDGGTRQLQLRLLTTHGLTVQASNWLRFEPKNQEFVGIPLAPDVGRSHYHLECVDSAGASVSDSIEVLVHHQQQHQQQNQAERQTVLPPGGVQFSLTLLNDFERFMADSLRRVQLVQRLATVFGDSDSRHVLVRALRPGSVELHWWNTSLSSPADDGDGCDHAAVTALRRKLLEDDGTVTARARSVMMPHFRLASAAVVPRGSCLSVASPTHRPSVAPDKTSGRDGDGDGDGSLLDAPAVPASRSHEYLVTFIVPAVVICVMLLTAALIACVLLRVRQRRRRLGRHKMPLTDATAYVSRGIPVIFSDELEPSGSGKQAGRRAVLTPNNDQAMKPGDEAAVPMLQHNEARAAASCMARQGSVVRRPPPYMVPSQQ